MAPQLIIEDQFGLSHIGLVRDSNQDAILVDPTKYIYLLADGMGGHFGGEIAAAMTLDILHSELSTLAEDANLAESIQSAYVKASDSIRARALQNPELKAMGTTAICGMLRKDTFHLGHVGDSRVYLLTAQGTLIQLTRDHSLIVEADIDAASQQGKLLKNVVTRSVGHSDPLEVDYLYFMPPKSGKLLICSDGLHGMLSDDEIGHRLNTPKSCKNICQVLVDQACKAGGQDNVSMIVIQFTVEK